MISIIDYGLGNICAFVNMYKRLNIKTCIATKPEEIANASHIILPGVGAFDHAMRLLNESGMREALDGAVKTRAVPVLGVCVGMQILAEASEEGVERGLGWISGHVRGFAGRNEFAGLPLPHMGWNDVNPSSGCELFKGLEYEARFYFLHSFFFQCDNPQDIAATSRYGQNFSSAVQHERVFGVQFHPEKSHNWGETLLKNFAAI
jgi:glutamine amidotransferase